VRWAQWNQRNKKSEGAVERTEAFRQGDCQNGLAERLNLPKLKAKNSKSKDSKGKKENGRRKTGKEVASMKGWKKGKRR
jgi:hypothetical protein